MSARRAPANDGRMGAIERRIAQKAKAMTREQVIVKAIEKRITGLELSHVIARKPYPSIDRLSDMQHAMSMSKPALREVAIEHSIDTASCAN